MNQYEELKAIVEADVWPEYTGLGRDGDCVEWEHSKGSHGYGQINIKRIPRCVHRLTWCLANGVDIEDLTSKDCVCHTCDNHACYRLSHLFMSDHKGNMRDMGAKGRRRNGREDQTHCKYGHEFTEENTYRRSSRPASRECIACMEVQHAAYRELHRERDKAKQRAKAAAETSEVRDARNAKARALRAAKRAAKE